MRATVVVAFRFFDLPRRNSSSFRENSHSRRGELSLAHEPSKPPSPHEELARDRTRRRCSVSASSIIAAARRRGLRGAKGRTRGNAVALFAVEHCRRGSAVAQSDRRCRPREPFGRVHEQPRPPPHAARASFFTTSPRPGARPPRPTTTLSPLT